MSKKEKLSRPEVLKKLKELGHPVPSEPRLKTSNLRARLAKYSAK